MMKVPKQYKEKEILYRRTILFAAIVVMIVLYFEKIGQIVTYVISICMPFLLGGGLAFIFNIIANALMKYGVRFLSLKESTWTRAVANIFSILIVFTIVFGFIVIIVPQIFSSLETIVNNSPQAIETFYAWAYRSSASIPFLHQWISDLSPNIVEIDNLAEWLGEIVNWVFAGGANTIVGSVYQVITTTFSYVFSTFVAIMFSIIVLFNKKTAVKEAKGLIRAYASDEVYERILHVVRLVSKTFTNYIGGTCMECLILGSLVTIMATILQIPYALLAGILVAIGALVPMFGALIAAILATLFIATASVKSAIYFIIMFVCIQQVEGNFIYPNVVGRSVGFPPMYVIVAVTIGASLAGVLGMIVFIPICTCIYQLLKEDVLLQLKRKKNY